MRRTILLRKSTTHFVHNEQVALLSLMLLLCDLIAHVFIYLFFCSLLIIINLCIICVKLLSLDFSIVWFTLLPCQLFPLANDQCPSLHPHATMSSNFANQHIASKAHISSCSDQLNTQHIPTAIASATKPTTNSTAANYSSTAVYYSNLVSITGR